KSIGFDRVLGEDRPPPPLEPADPLPALVQALIEPRNWGSELSARAASVVALRDPSRSGEVLLHPLGELSVRQQVVPLGITIERFGNTTPAADRRFDVEVLGPEGDAVLDAEPVFDLFAPGQFLELPDA